ncbi:MAG: choice-of-anchor T family protein, partial [Candidatus Poseidoniaceae archaeon]|nr:choice-of-anchor T family protein [Candidatus Poseidoniaceae archaeon]
MKRAALLVVLFLLPMASFSAEAQGFPIGIELECDQQTIDINVHPLQNEPVTITCTVTNTGSFKQNVNLDSSVEGNDFGTPQLSESSLEMETGDEVDFTVTFSAQPRIEVASESFNIIASIESFGPQDPFMVPAGALNQSAEVNGEVRSLPYSRLDLTMTDTSSRDLESGGVVSFMFTVFNDGNRVDEIEVSVPNKQEFMDAGFTFVTDPFARAQIQPGSSSDQLTITLMAPSDNSKSLSIDIVLSAASQLDSTAEKSELTIKVNVESEGGGSGDGIDLGDFDVSSGDSMATIGMISGGVILVILMLVLMSRLSK